MVCNFQVGVTIYVARIFQNVDKCIGYFKSAFWRIRYGCENIFGESKQHRSHSMYHNSCVIINWLTIQQQQHTRCNSTSGVWWGWCVHNLTLPLWRHRERLFLIDPRLKKSLTKSVRKGNTAVKKILQRTIDCLRTFYSSIPSIKIHVLGKL